MIDPELTVLHSGRHARRLAALDLHVACQFALGECPQPIVHQRNRTRFADFRSGLPPMVTGSQRRARIGPQLPIAR
jgi:hypothetical protein